ncbi:MAG TPA: GlsB/YeaQ/YmgE family stress response membrane protein [Aliidongia sp.]|nr:GlsB/YeaQ/YmgE family stress response membrane protein [Aliidongia sp.]
MFHLIGIVIVGFLAGIIARFLSPAPNNPQGFLLTTLLGIAGAFVANFIGYHLGLYSHGHHVGLIGSTIGAVIVLAIWHWYYQSGSRSY